MENVLTDDFELDRGCTLTQFVDNFNTVFSRILWHTVADIKSHVAKVKCDMEA